MNLATCPYGTGRFGPFNRKDFGLFAGFRDLTHTSQLKADDCLVVWGGADISPSLYNKKVSSMTGADMIPSYRDKFEWHFMQQAIGLGIPIIGICRGAQMLCAAAGGKLVQDVDNHAVGRTHEIRTYDGKTLNVNSLHHQMMYPWGVEHELIAWAPEKLSKDRAGNPNYTDVNEAGEDIQIEVPCEPEFVYFPKIKGFAIQWHPEFMDDHVPATDYIFNFMKERLHENAAA